MMECKSIRVMGPPPEPGTHYFDFDRFVHASGLAEQRLREFITGFRSWEPCSPYVIDNILRDAAEVEHGIPGSFEEIAAFSPTTPVMSYELYEGEKPQRAIFAHVILWLEHRSFINRLELHRHLLEGAPAERLTVNLPKRTFDKDTLKKLSDAKVIACQPFDANKWRKFRSKMVSGPAPIERVFEALFMQVSVERARVMREHDPPIMLGIHSPALVDDSPKAATVEVASDPFLEIEAKLRAVRIQPKPLRLLKFCWPRRSVTIRELVPAVWKEPPSVDAAKQCASRANAALESAGIGRSLSLADETFSWNH